MFLIAQNPVLMVFVHLPVSANVNQDLVDLHAISVVLQIITARNARTSVIVPTELSAIPTMENVTAEKVIEEINARAHALQTDTVKNAQKNADVKMAENAITSQGNVIVHRVTLGHYVKIVVEKVATNVDQLVVVKTVVSAMKTPHFANVLRDGLGMCVLTVVSRSVSV